MHASSSPTGDHLVNLRDVPRVLLIWPGGLYEAGGTFGVPQMLNVAQYVRKQTGAHVDVRDLDHELAFGSVKLLELCRGYDVIGLSCYSSFDYLKTLAMAHALKRAYPKTWLVTGGYHPSARPRDFTRVGSPFDYVVVGDGEVPMARLVEGLTAGRRPLQRVLGPEALPSPNDVIPYDWSLLDRYRQTARTRASQVEIYLSRGCPYDCSFCMERAKRETSWRALTPDAAVEELHRVDAHLDLSSWTLRVTDPLFGMKREWRRNFLEQLARRPLRARKIWLLIRLDLVEREDFELMARCNVAPGFGLESGDPRQLRLIRKTGMLSGYLDKMLQIAEWARETHVPFGANIIAGHPGETEQSLRNSAEYMKKLFLDPKGTLGFLSVDPFRLYPGSPIDEDLAGWQRDTGMRVHRYPWWEDADQSFLSEWVDPSADLDYTRREALTHELFAPIVDGVRRNFTYQGPATDYFKLALDEQVAVFSERRRTYKLERLQRWEQRFQQVTSSRNSQQSVAQVPSAGLAEAQGLENGPPWANAVFHVLAHVDVGNMPSTAYWPSYVRYCAKHLGSAEDRPLGGDAELIARLTPSHETFARLQTLAWLFETEEQALACAERGLLDLKAADVARPELLPLLRQAGPSAEVLFCAALLELPEIARLPQLNVERAELARVLSAIRFAAPELSCCTIQLLPALGPHGRVSQNVIWVGVPCAELEVSAEQVAWQAAHEATVAELWSRQPGKQARRIDLHAKADPHKQTTERKVEQAALRLLRTRSKTAHLAL